MGSKYGVPLKWEPNANSVEPKIQTTENTYTPTADKHTTKRTDITLLYRGEKMSKFIMNHYQFICLVNTFDTMHNDLQEFPNLSINSPDSISTTAFLLKKDKLSF